MVYYICHCMSLHVCIGESFVLDSRLANFWERKCPFGFFLVVFDCGAVTLSVSFVLFCGVR